MWEYMESGQSLIRIKTQMNGKYMKYVSIIALKYMFSGCVG